MVVAPRILLLVGSALVAIAVVVSTLVVLGREGRLPSVADVPLLTTAADCTVAGVDLTREEAERLTSTAAGSRRPARAAVTQVVPAADVERVRRALNGRSKAALSCRVDGDRSYFSRQTLRPNGLTPRADVVRRDVRRAFGPLRLGGFAPGGVSSGHRAGSAHYEGRAVDVFFRPVSAANKVRGWALAHYLVAHAERLEVATVIFDGRIWTRWRSGEGWRSYDIDTGDVPRRTRQILEHRDHVHVDVG